MKAKKELFNLKENGTTVRTEIIAGVTTFMTMAYILVLNPNILTNYGLEGKELWNGAFLATCIASAIGTFVMAFLTNKPIAMAPGMGLNTVFAAVTAGITAITGMTYLQSFQAMLAVVFLEGSLFIILSLLKVREKIIEAIPLGIRLGISPAIGMLLLDIGFGSNVSIYSEKGGPFYAMRDFFGALTSGSAREQIGSQYNEMLLSVITIILGLVVIIALEHRKAKSSILIGIAVSAVFYWILEAAVLGRNPFDAARFGSFIPPFGDMASTTLFKLNFAGLAQIGFAAVASLVISLCIVDLFDTIGMLVGAASRAGMLDKDGMVPKMREALLSDAIGTVAGSLTGTSTVSSYVESAAGVSAGGRTGLTSVVTGILFLLSMFISPVMAVIPAAATSPALIYVGILMLANLKMLDFSDLTQIIPIGIMMLAMPITGSIGNGIGLALIFYTIIMLVTGRAKKLPVLTYVLTAVFACKFFALGI